MSVVLVTGASRGIGRAIVARFVREGCNVIACARGEAGLAELKADFPNVDGIACDMRDGAAVDALACEVQARHGAVDLLVNNAGAYRPGQIASEDDDALLDMLQANLFGAYRLTRRVLPAMMARHWADGCKPKWCVGPKSAKPLASGLRSSVDRRNYDYISEQAEQLMLST